MIKLFLQSKHNSYGLGRKQVTLSIKLDVPTSTHIFCWSVNINKLVLTDQLNLRNQIILNNFVPVNYLVSTVATSTVRPAPIVVDRLIFLMN